MIATLTYFGLWALAILVVIGIIRVIIKPYRGFGDFLLDLLLLDLLGDLLEIIIEILADN